MSSICVPNSLAMAWASRMDGLYFPFSNEMMVWRETPSGKLLLRHAPLLPLLFNDIFHAVLRS